MFLEYLIVFQKLMNKHFYLSKSTYLGRGRQEGHMKGTVATWKEFLLANFYSPILRVLSSEKFHLEVVKLKFNL